MSPVVDLQRRRWKRYEEDLMEKLTAFGRQVCSESSLNHALEQYWGSKGLTAPDFDDETSFARFFDWFLFDYRRGSRSRRVIERFRTSCWEDLCEEERQLLAEWERASLGVYEVAAVHSEDSLTLVHLFTGERLEVVDRGAARSLDKYDLIFTRPLKVFGSYSLSASGLVVPRSWKRALEALARHEYARFRRRHPGADWAEFFRHRAYRINRFLVEMFLDRPRPRLKTTSGEEVILCRAWFEVGDPDEVARRLDAAPCLRPDAGVEDGAGGPARAWTWCQPGGEIGSLVLGEVRLRGSRLSLRCLSRERLAAGKRLLGEVIGDLGRHRVDDYRGPEALVRGRALARLGAGESLPEEVASVVQQFLSNYYRRWVDEPMPALGGRSPRQACATQEGRVQVVELLKYLENVEEKKKRAGQPYVEVSLIRRELGLPEED